MKIKPYVKGEKMIAPHNGGWTPSKKAVCDGFVFHITPSQWSSAGFFIPLTLIKNAMNELETKKGESENGKD